MKKLLVITIVATLGIQVIATMPKKSEFEGNEPQWQQTCSQYITDPSLQETCREFLAYMQTQKESYLKEADSIQSKIDSLKNDIDRLTNLSKEYSEQIASLNSQLSQAESSIVAMEQNIVLAQQDIEKNESNISKRKEHIMDRMLDLQVDINTNQYFDFIMGAGSFVDLLQRVQSIQTLTESDQKLIEQLKDEIQKLETAKVEYARLQDTLELQKESLIYNKERVASLEEGNKAIMQEYQKVQANLTAEKNRTMAAANTSEANMPSLDFGTLPEDGSEPEVPLPPMESASLIRPVQAGYISAGTWSYPNGWGLHLGVDFAAPIGTPIYAPADAIVLYANNPVSSNGGYLGNWEGTPLGGGNTVKLLMEVNGEVYSMNFYHCSQNMPVIGKSSVKQGEVIAYVGNSGNTSGAHLHLEVLKLSINKNQAINAWNATKDWQYGTGWDIPANCGSQACKLRPEEVFGL